MSYVTDSATRRLLDAGRVVVSDLDLESVLPRVLATAAEVTQARYAAIDPQPYEALLQGVLLTERDATYMRREAGGAAGDSSISPTQDLWWPPTKIAGRELARHIGGSPRRFAPAKREGVEVRIPVTDA